MQKTVLEKVYGEKGEEEEADFPLEMLESFLEQFRLLLKCNDSHHQGNTDLFLHASTENISFQNCKYKI